MKKNAAVFALVVTAFIPASSLATNPSAIPDLVRLWAKPLNRPVVWEAGNDFDGRIVQFEEIDTSRLDGFKRALAGLNAVLEQAGHASLKACFFDSAIVIRSVAQPACDQPIRANIMASEAK